MAQSLNDVPPSCPECGSHLLEHRRSPRSDELYVCIECHHLVGPPASDAAHLAEARKGGLLSRLVRRIMPAR
jgi:DNA-directed RNA polymerase subunit RPC12/RpoP